jgi:hypothetical protein
MKIIENRQLFNKLTDGRSFVNSEVIEISGAGNPINLSGKFFDKLAKSRLYPKKQRL